MKVAYCKIKSVAPYCASRYHDTPKLEKERADEYEARTWKEKGYYDADGKMYVPGQALKFMLESTAKFLSISVPGKGKATFTKNFLAGIMCPDNAYIGATRETVVPTTFLAHATGKRGPGPRVKRTVPTVLKWETEFPVYVLDDSIPKNIFEYVLNEAGKFNGLGQGRAQTGGTNGRFQVMSVEWSEK